MPYKIEGINKQKEKVQDLEREFSRNPTGFKGMAKISDELIKLKECANKVDREIYDWAKERLLWYDAQLLGRMGMLEFLEYLRIDYPINSHLANC